MPTDALTITRGVMLETQAYGFEKLRAEQIALGAAVRAMLVTKGFPSVAAAGFEAPGVVVSYTSDAELSSSKKMLAQGLQIAAGVPLMCDEGADYRTFRVGLFGLDKLHNVERSVRALEQGLERAMGGVVGASRPAEKVA